MEASITLKKVGKLVGDKTILASLTFGIEKGSLVAIIGDNEAGKSMLLRVISGIEYQEYGQIFINGLDSKKRRNERNFFVQYSYKFNSLKRTFMSQKGIRFFIVYNKNFCIGHSFIFNFSRYSTASAFFFCFSHSILTTIEPSWMS